MHFFASVPHLFRAAWNNLLPSFRWVKVRMSRTRERAPSVSPSLSLPAAKGGQRHPHGTQTRSGVLTPFFQTSKAAGRNLALPFPLNPISEGLPCRRLCSLCVATGSCRDCAPKMSSISCFRSVCHFCLEADSEVVNWLPGGERSKTASSRLRCGQGSSIVDHSEELKTRSNILSSAVFVERALTPRVLR